MFTIARESAISVEFGKDSEAGRGAQKLYS